MKKKLFILAVILTAAAGCNRLKDAIPEAKNAPDEAYNKLFTFTNGVVGSSLTHSIALPDGRTLWLFADSFIGTANTDRSTSIDKVTAVKNAAMVQTVNAFLPINIIENGKAKNLVDPVTAGDYLIPMHGAANGGNIEVFIHEYNVTQRFLKLQIATFSFPALKFLGFTDLKNPTGITYGDYIYTDDTYHYIFGRETRGIDIKIHVARVAIGKLANQATWQYYNGSTFATEPAASQAIFGTSAKLYSVLKQAGKFKIILQKDSKVLAYTAPALTGPYDAGKTLFTTAETIPTSNAFVHTQFLTASGQYLISYDIQSLGNQNQNYLKNIDVFRSKFYRHNLE